jgi:tetratricopeptide repeat protein
MDGTYVARISDAADEFLATDPGPVRAHNQRGLALESLGRPHDSLQAFDTAIRLDPADARSHANRSIPLQSLGRFHDALDACDTAAGLDPADAWMQASRGYALQGPDRFHNALDAYDTAIGINPGYAQPYTGRGECLMMPTGCRGDRALLHLTGLAGGQDPAVVPGQERAHRIARGVLVPAGAIGQVVQASGPIQAGCLRDRPAVSRDLRHQQPTQIEQAVRSQVAAMAGRRQVRRELGGCRFNQSGIYTGGASRPVFIMGHNIMITGWPARARSALATVADGTSVAAQRR